MYDIEELRLKLRRPANAMVLGENDQTPAVSSSWFGRVTMALKGEEWPTCNGKAMLPLCQIDCAELPHTPDNLNGISFMTLFISNDSFDFFPERNAINGKGWLLRTYNPDHQLVSIEHPAPLARPRRFWDFAMRPPSLPIKPCQISWEAVEDYPHYNDAVRLYPGIEAHIDDYDELFEHCYDSKIGGWPTLTQSSIFEGFSPEPDYVFQLANEEEAGWFWGDLGIATFGRYKEENGREWIFDMNYT